MAVSYKDVVLDLRKVYRSGRTKSYSWRIQQLDNLHAMLTENEDKICLALKQDLNKPAFESALTEVVLIKKDIVECKRSLKSWMKPERKSRDLATAMSILETRRDSLGVCLIISAFNYPLALLFCPLIGAIVGGNCSFLKPSDQAYNTAVLAEELVEKYMDTDCIKCFRMERAASTLLLNENRFDHIFYTGGPWVGKMVMEAASKHLTPVVLELGGKNPCYVEDGMDVDYAAQRIAWAKHVNAGQICINVDYIICSKKMQSKLVEALKKRFDSFYPEGNKNSEDYCRIVTKKHTERIVSLITKEKVVYGGEFNIEERYIAPTIMTNINMNDPVMTEEIFGPLLPILPIAENIDEACEFISNEEKALSAYIFSNNDKSIEKFLQNTSSGGVGVNDIMMHYTAFSLPFGGVGQSGMGAYHGKYSFNCFTHEKAIFKQTSIGRNTGLLVLPPYANMAWRQTVLEKLFMGLPFDHHEAWKWVKVLLDIGVYAVVAYIMYQKFML